MKVQSRFSTRIEQGLKRGLDIALALAGLIFLSPLFLAIGIAVKLDSPGKVIYRHKRVGRNGVPFSLLKFRSMMSGGDDTSYMQYLNELIQSERNGDGQPLPYRKLGADPRVTRVGRVLRTFYLDELPQLVNILRGDMSLVGPRPHVQFEVDHYTEEQRRRLSTRPGATGLWQVVGKADCTFSELIDLDLQYIDHWSFWLDVKIILKTIALFLKGGEGFWARMAKRIPVTPGTKAQGQSKDGKVFVVKPVHEPKKSPEDSASPRMVSE